MSAPALSVRNTEVVETSAIPILTVTEFRAALIERVSAGERITAFFARAAAEKTTFILTAVLANGVNGTFSIFSAVCEGRFPSVAKECPQAELFEREIAETWGILPEGHPWLKPVRDPRRTEFFRVEGDDIHEVAVGPVHAGIIEPGHFRFQCRGEIVLHLEIALGYQHRGVERRLVGGPDKRTLPYMETLAGDTSVGHATAFAHLIEALKSGEIPARADALRAVALELERLANHVGDLGALAADVGFLPTASYAGRLRGDFLNMTAELCGSRFGRGLVRVGGVRFDIDRGQRERLLEKLMHTMRDVTQAANLLWNSPSVLSRFEGSGRLSPETAEQLGVVGPAARACGLERDVRSEFPSGYFRFSHIPTSTWHTGDVFSRAHLRWIEIQRSAAFVREQLDKLPEGAVRAEGLAADPAPLAPNRLAVSTVEGWRGEICHVGITDERGRIAGYKIVDPSFHNWKALSLALRGAPISDFPLINKSFNLSYAGYDL